jgi:aspartate racemase
MPGHVGIVACSAPGAALCYELIATGPGPILEISVNAQPFGEYMRRIAAGDWEGVAELMLVSAGKLAAVGADFLIAPCNTIHQAIEHVIPRSPLPWLHIATAVVAEAQRLGYRRVGLLGTRLTMESRVYPSEFERAGIEHCVPEARERAEINRFIFDEMVGGAFTPAAKQYFTSAIQRLKERGCDAAGLCCTELPVLLGGAPAALPLLDSTRILAQAALARSAKGCESQ